MSTTSQLETALLSNDTHTTSIVVDPSCFFDNLPEPVLLNILNFLGVKVHHIAQVETTTVAGILIERSQLNDFRFVMSLFREINCLSLLKSKGSFTDMMRQINQSINFPNTVDFYSAKRSRYERRLNYCSGIQRFESRFGLLIFLLALVPAFNLTYRLLDCINTAISNDSERSDSKSIWLRLLDITVGFFLLSLSMAFLLASPDFMARFLDRKNHSTTPFSQYVFYFPDNFDARFTREEGINDSLGLTQYCEALSDELKILNEKFEQSQNTILHEIKYTAETLPGLEKYAFFPSISHTASAGAGAFAGTSFEEKHLEG